MVRFVYRFVFLSFLFTGTIALTSCLPEQKIARTFTSSKQEINLLVNPPDFVYKFNHKGEEIEGFDSMKPADQDSALWNYSRYIKYLSDSILLEKYMNNFIEELRLLGFNVYLVTTLDSFDMAKPQSYILDISQIQLDEYTYPYEEEAEFFDSVFIKRIDLNAVDYSAWFDLRKANVEVPRTTVLYGTNTIYDELEGRFFNDPFSGRIRYKYSIDSIRLEEVYDMSASLGKIHAGYLYDFFLNQYIARNLPDGMEMVDYYHYIRKRNMIVSAYENRFEILGTK